MPHTRTLRVLAGIAIVFGLLTVFSGGRALFGDAQARAAVGHAVPFVLWFNFLAGAGYVAAGVALLRGQRWAPWLVAGLAAATGVVGVALGVHVLRGGAYEMRTIAAMGLRLVFLTLLARVSLRTLQASKVTSSL